MLSVDDIVLSKFSTICHRGRARCLKSQAIKNSFECKDTCQINFDGKLIKDLLGHQQICYNLDPSHRTKDFKHVLNR